MPQTGTCEGSHPPTVTEKVPLYVHLIAGGGAGFIESCTCHPLDTIKVRLQLQTRLKNASTSARVMEVPMQTGQGIQAKIPIQRRTSGTANLGPFSMGLSIVRNEGYLALYKGLGAVVTAIVPKMAIRFTSFEYFKSLFQKSDNHLQPYSQGKIFIAGLGAGITETMLVVNPTEVIKIRIQANVSNPKYMNAATTFYHIVKDEGIVALYKGVTLTAARQATNQAVNFTVYGEFKRFLQEYQHMQELPPWQHLLAGGISGALAPIANAPIDTLKTRIQRQITTTNSETGFRAIYTCAKKIIQQEGFLAFYNGLTPRLLRIAPGQAITFMTYEKISSFIKS